MPGTAGCSCTGRAPPARLPSPSPGTAAPGSRSPPRTAWRKSSVASPPPRSSESSPPPPPASRVRLPVPPLQVRDHPLERLGERVASRPLLQGEANRLPPRSVEQHLPDPGRELFERLRQGERVVGRP